MAEDKHPGISMHKLPVASGFIGAVFTVGCALIFLLGLPQLWYFVAFSAILGIAIAGIIGIVNDRRTTRMKPLSILSAEGSKSPTKDGDAEVRPSRLSFRAKPRNPSARHCVVG